MMNFVLKMMNFVLKIDEFNTASASGLTPLQASVYSASKAGVIHFGRGIAEGLRLDKVHFPTMFRQCFDNFIEVF